MFSAKKKPVGLQATGFFFAEKPMVSP